MANPFRSDFLRRAMLAGATLLALVLPAAAAAAERLTVFAAASLKPPLDVIAADWGDVAISYGGSGTLAKQVAAGAPADVVILAAQDWMDWLGGQDVLAGPPVPVARNRLVIAGPPGSAPVALTRDALLERLGPEGRLAIGDPVSVPAGRYAKEALDQLGLWEALSDRLLLAEDVRAALAYVVRGDVPLGIVYRSDATGTGVATLADIPAGAHGPIVYRGAVVKGAESDAQAFLDNVAASGDVFTAFGFGD